ncbi:hypothetical protein [Streptomyces monomycini]|uniref:hypothetical protein n=1 Tax=Streptomyces monomycini TaxID=371720 RepID=UPI0004ABB685|nr:hypothetical protein [Streptomyces monomycini]
MSQNTLLSYHTVTYPDPLRTTTDNGESIGTVHLIVFNHHKTTATWETIEIIVPEGTESKDLTTDPGRISPSASADNKFERKQPSRNVFLATPGKSRGELYRGDSLVLTLDNVLINKTAGLSVLTVVETAAGGDTKAVKDLRYGAAGVLKLDASKIPPPKPANIPRNFRPEKAIVADGKDVVLNWEGPDAEYTILLADGTRIPMDKTTARAWKPQRKEHFSRRDTTYTLVATLGGQNIAYLTTTVHIEKPDFSQGLYTPWVQSADKASWIQLTKDQVNIKLGEKIQGIYPWGKLATGKVDTNSVTAAEDVEVKGAFTVTKLLTAKGDISVSYGSQQKITTSGTNGAHIGGGLQVDESLTVNGYLTAESDITVLYDKKEKFTTSGVQGLKVDGKDVACRGVNYQIVDSQYGRYVNALDDRNVYLNDGPGHCRFSFR